MDEKNTILEKIKTLVTHASQFKGMEFRMALENLVKEGEKPAEELMISLLNDSSLVPDLRMEIIRVAGYLRCPSFLFALKKIIDTVQHSRLQQEAIISVSKFNDRSALNILNQTLQKINNPMLLSTINAEISRIKENNPILALMPRFLEGQKNPKSFKIALDILRRILTPEHVTVFTKFLNSPDPLIQNGAFEILCITGDIFHDNEILGFYETRFHQIPCITAPECDELYLLTHHFKQYLTRYQFIMEEQLGNLQEKFAHVRDIRVRQLLLAMICKSKKDEIISFIEATYSDDEKLRPTIIEELAGNDVASPFLFTLYRAKEPLNESIIRTLLSLKEGLDYFVHHFFTLSFEDQAIIVRFLPYNDVPDLVELVKNIFLSDTYRLKELLLTKVKENYEFKVKDLLFDPEREREFFFMGQDYFDTISQLFPVTTVKRLLEKIVVEDLAVSKTKKYLQLIEKIIPMELIFNFKDKEFIAKLFAKIINANNLELTLLFLNIFKYIKTLDIDTYHNINESLSLFITKRETNLTPQEKGELRRIKTSFHDMFLEFKRIEEGFTALKRLIQSQDFDFELLERAIIEHRMTLVMKKELLNDYLAHAFTTCSHINLGDWMRFFTRFPHIAQMLAPIIQKKVPGNEAMLNQDKIPFSQFLEPTAPRILLNFHHRQLTAALLESLAETTLDTVVVYNEPQMKEMDILLCDPEMLREFLLRGLTLPQRIYLFLDKSEGFAEFKAYNVRTFVFPFSFYRIIKDILQSLYLEIKAQPNNQTID